MPRNVIINVNNLTASRKLKGYKDSAWLHHAVTQTYNNCAAGGCKRSLPRYPKGQSSLLLPHD